MEPTTTRQRIAAAYSPETLETLGNSLIRRVADHFRQLQLREGNVLNWFSPEQNLPVARESLDCYQNISSLEGRFEELLNIALSRGHNLHHPRYIGHQVPASVPIAALFDALGALTNQVMAIYEMGPWITSIERSLIENWGARLGLQPGSFSGLVTHGGSLANLTALLTARNVSLGGSWQQGVAQNGNSPVLICQADAHYSVTRSAGILGLGSNNVRKTPLDARRRMSPEHLDSMLETLRRAGTPVVAVSASACATPIGAFDPLEDIADVCAKHEVWLHVDAAHGGAVAFSAKYRHLVRGIERADSMICDAHKTLFVPALCAFVFYRDRNVRFETFQQDAPYLFDPSAPGMADIDSGMLTIECTKRAAAYGLWGLWSMFGPQLFEDLIDQTFELTRNLYEKIAEAEDFEPLHEPECNIQVFRYLPPAKYAMKDSEIGELNRQIRRQLIESGQFYIVQTTLDGIGALRVTVMNPLTENSDFDQLLNTIRNIAQTILKTD